MTQRMVAESLFLTQGRQDAKKKILKSFSLRPCVFASLRSI